VSSFHVTKEAKILHLELILIFSEDKKTEQKGAQNQKKLNMIILKKIDD